MTTRYLRPGSTDLNAAVYNDQSDYSGTDVAPAGMSAADIVEITEGSQAIATNADALNAVNLAKVIVRPGSKVTTADGVVIDLQCSTAFEYAGQGDQFAIKATVGTNDGISRIDANHDVGNLIVTETPSGSDPIDNIYQNGDGKITINAAAEYTNRYQTAGLAEIAEEGSGISAPTLEVVTGGRTETNRSSTTPQLSGEGVLYRQKGHKKPTTLKLFTGATYSHESTGTITTVEYYGGNFDPENAPTDFTVTTLENYASKDDPGQFFDQAGGITVTIGTNNNNSGKGTAKK